MKAKIGVGRGEKLTTGWAGWRVMGGKSEFVGIFGRDGVS
jgi:hypothetical protein